MGITSRVILGGFDSSGMFKIEVDTTKAGSASNTFVLPIGGGTVGCTVYWGDGNSDDYTSSGSKTHVYSSSGTYTVSITGACPGIIFNNGGDKAKLIDIIQWGNIAWATMSSAFEGCTGLTTLTATDAPDISGVVNMTSVFEGCTSFNGAIGNWNTSNVTNMTSAFNKCYVFNQDIDGWDVSSVTGMTNMFKQCSVYNQSMNSWDVSNVTAMNSMFLSALVFNGDITSWTTTSLGLMTNMFDDAKAFNQDISGWDVSGVASMIGVFDTASVFNQDISAWDVSNVTTMATMFNKAAVFNQPLNWTTSSLVTVTSMFNKAYAFDQDISAWDISALTTAGTFMNLSGFTQTNYDLLLVAWENKTHNNNVTIHFGSAKYGAGAPATAHGALVADGWIITDGGPA